MKLKRIIAGVIALVMCFSFAACGADNEDLPIDGDGLDIITDVNTMPTLAPVTTTEKTTTSSTTTNSTSMSEETTTEESEETTTTSIKYESESETSESTSNQTSASTTVQTTHQTTQTAVQTTAAPVTTVGTTASIPASDIMDMGGSETTVVTTNSPIENTDKPTDTPIELVGIKDIIDVNNAGKQAFYSQLTEDEKSNYQKILDAVYNFKGQVKFDKPLTDEEYEKAFALVYYQNPELFWLEGRLMLSDDGTTATLVYLFSKDQAKSYQQNINKRFKQLASNMTTNLSDLQKVIVCNNWLALNNSFVRDEGNSQNIYGAIVEGYAQCEGYAKAMLWMMNKLNIPAVLLVGTKDTGASHAWVQVKLDGEWYNVDPVGNDPVLPVEDKMNVSYRYLCVPNSVVFDKVWFNVNCSPQTPGLKYFEPMSCTSYTMNGDVNYGVYAETYEEAYEKLKQSMIKAVEKGALCAHVKVGNDEAYVETQKRLSEDGEIWNIVDAINAMYETPVIKKASVSSLNSLNYIEIFMTYETN